MKSRKEVCRDYYLRNKDKVKAYYAYFRHLDNNGTAKNFQYRLKRLYNITVETYVRMRYTTQHNKCKVCRIEFEEARGMGCVARQAVVDHCHTTGTIRGILCNQCNKAIGFFGDRLDLLDKIKEYLNEKD